MYWFCVPYTTAALESIVAAIDAPPFNQRVISLSDFINDEASMMQQIKSATLHLNNHLAKKHE